MGEKMYYYGIDWTFLVLALPAMVLALICSARVKSTFKKYGEIYNSTGMTGYDAARRVLDANGLNYVQIQRIDGELTDHYDPAAKVIRLSNNVYDAATPAAVGVAAHEAGHAVQHAVNYGPFALRSSIVKVTNIGSKLSMPLILAGIVLSSMAHFESLIYLAYAGVACYFLCVIFQLVTLPTEFNASKRAVSAIESSGMLTNEELKGAKKVLRAAAMTYVAALAVALTQFLRLLIIVSNNRRRN